MTRYQKIAFEDYIGARMGRSSSADDYRIVETLAGKLVQVEISPKAHDDDHAGGRGKHGYDVKLYLDKTSGRVVKRTIGG